MNIETYTLSSERIYEQIDWLMDIILMPATKKILSSGELEQIFAEFLGSHYSSLYKAPNSRIRTLDKAQCRAFVPWLLFNWREFKGNRIIAEIHMRDAELMSSLSAKQKDWINEICKGYYSFYQIISDCYQSRTMILCDMILGNEIIVEYDSYIGKLLLLPGEVIFAKIISIMQKNIIVAMMPNSICNLKKSEIMQLQEVIRRIVVGYQTSDFESDINKYLTATLQSDLYEPILRKCYFDFNTQLFWPKDQNV